jgi:hypothetical protein
MPSQKKLGLLLIYLYTSNDLTTNRHTIIKMAYKAFSNLRRETEKGSSTFIASELYSNLAERQGFEPWKGFPP